MVRMPRRAVTAGSGAAAVVVAGERSLRTVEPQAARATAAVASVAAVRSAARAGGWKETLLRISCVSSEAYVAADRGRRT
jgi:hypothetical protein